MPENAGVLRGVERAAQLLSRYLARTLGGGLTDAEAHVLFHLQHLPPGVRPSLRELQQAFGMPASTMTAVADRLERQGLVRRELNPGDRRSWLLVPTPSARHAIERVSDVLETLEADVRAAVGDRDLEGFRAVLAALEGRLR